MTISRSPSFPRVARHSRTIYFLHAQAWLENNRIRESPSGWHGANQQEIPECGYLRVSSLIRALRVTLRSRKIAPGDFFLIVLKHEGNMPFENDGLRGVVARSLLN